ncbi:hypothetical protein RS694_11125 [Rhodoferax saidenbachensis]|uniref:DUF1214 domain-containing protein n=1 Tax=Rhodoferax saidenbachensis TaxID=1484693 RepID=A0A1P8KFK4_9BURK|nr:hypothetical protein RS694_11125 [Rhodoferax saidenbachensis]
MRRIAIGFALYLGAVALGLGSAWWVLKKAPFTNRTVQAGAWRTNTLAGSTDADMYTRAGVAVNGLLALGRDETMYFIATHDDAGRPLRSQCSYRVAGEPPKARWWSVTVYADDMFLFDAPNQHYSLNGSTAQLDAQGRFAFSTGHQAQPDTFWLPTPGNRGMVMTLRLYNPEPSLQAAPASLVPPTIQQTGDCA